MEPQMKLPIHGLLLIVMLALPGHALEAGQLTPNATYGESKSPPSPGKYEIGHPNCSRIELSFYIYDPASGFYRDLKPGLVQGLNQSGPCLSSMNYSLVDDAKNELTIEMSSPADKQPGNFRLLGSFVRLASALNVSAPSTVNFVCKSIEIDFARQYYTCETEKTYECAISNNSTANESPIKLTLKRLVLERRSDANRTSRLEPLKCDSFPWVMVLVGGAVALLVLAAAIFLYFYQNKY